MTIIPDQLQKTNRRECQAQRLVCRSAPDVCSVCAGKAATPAGCQSPCGKMWRLCPAPPTSVQKSPKIPARKYRCPNPSTRQCAAVMTFSVNCSWLFGSFFLPSDYLTVFFKLKRCKHTAFCRKIPEQRIRK